MDPSPAKNESEVAERLEEWEEKCRRLANFGKQYAPGDVYKRVAVKKILVGQAKINFELWEKVGNGTTF